MKHVLRWCAALVALALALPAQAAEATKISDVAHSVFFRGGSGTRGAAGTNGGHYSDRYFNGDFTDYTYCNGDGVTELVIDVSHIVTDPEGQAYVTDVLVGHQGNAQYSLYYTNEPEPEWEYNENGTIKAATDPRTWTPIAGADHVQEAGTKTYGVNDFATAVKYVFNTCPNWTTHLAEVEVQGYEYVPAKAVKISTVGRSVFFRGGSGTRGAAGTNGGHYSDRYFNGDFTDYTYCNGDGVTELVIPTTGLDDQGTDTGVAWYVTDFKVGHQGNAQYSLYYTDEPEPENLTSYASDPRTWTLIPGADHVQEAGTKTFGVNAFATAVKYVFNTCPNWTTHLAEVEVWAMDPSSITCLHPNMTDDSPAWTVCKAATCTENGFEERFCPDCGARFEREVPLSKLGHDFVATLTAPGSATSYGSGYVECSRCNEFHLEFNGDTVDLTTLGGPPINGIVQYTDLYASSLGAEDGGIKPVYMMDNIWDNGWGHAYYFAECSSNEYAQYSFGTTIDLTKIEYSVINESQTVYFSKFDPTSGVETLLRTIPIKKDTSEGAPGYQRKTEMFFGEGDAEHVFVDAIRMRIGDYVDPDTGEVTRYIGYNYGAHDRHTIICEFHPWGTIEGAGMTGTPAAMIGDAAYETLADALADVEEGAETTTTIVVQKDLEEDVVIPAGKNVTLDLHGNSITNVVSDTISVYGTLTITDTIGGGKIVSALPAKADLVNYPTGTVTIQGGTFAVPDNATYYNIKNMGAMTIQAGATVVSRVSTASTLIANGWYGNATTDRDTTGQANTAILTINGGTFDGGKNVVKNDDYGILTINGGTFGNLSENDAVIMNWHETTITGGTFTGATKVLVNGSYGADSADKGVMTVSGGTFTATAEGGTLFGYGLEGGHMADAVITVTGGTFSGAVQGLRDNDGTYGFAYVSGGTFDEAVPQIYCAEGFAPYEQTKTQTVTDPETGAETQVEVGTGVYGVKPVWTVTFVNEKGEAPAAQVLDVVEGKDLFAAEPDPAPAAEGFTFLGWFAPEAETAFDFANTPITGDLTLTAAWEEIVAELDPVDVGAGLADYDWGGEEPKAPMEVVPADGADPESLVVRFVGKAGVTYQLVGSATLSLDEDGWLAAKPAGKAVTPDADGIVELVAPMDAAVQFFKIKASK